MTSWRLRSLFCVNSRIGESGHSARHAPTQIVLPVMKSDRHCFETRDSDLVFGLENDRRICDQEPGGSNNESMCATSGSTHAYIYLSTLLEDITAIKCTAWLYTISFRSYVSLTGLGSGLQACST